MVYKLSNRRIVVKFGGSSIRDSFNEALEFVLRLYENNEVMVVLSALEGVTDALLHLAKSKDDSVVQQITKMHYNMCDKFGIDHSLLDPLFRELALVLKSEGRFPNKSAYVDHVLSFGERLSVMLFASALRNFGIEAEAIDAFHVVKTDGSFGSARVDFPKTAKRVKILERMLNEGKVPVVTGFLGSYRGFRTTLGRGGSDYTATVLGSLLGSRAVLIMSDVRGIYSADPKVVRDAKLIPFVSYDEALIASTLGMRALHKRAIGPVRDRLPVILGKTNGHRLGTLISDISAGVPILTHKILNDDFACIGVVGLEKVNFNAPIYRKGTNWVSFIVKREKLAHYLNALHGVIFDESLSSSNDSELWARI